jgi:Mg/Co/Ni transporter MgtE
VFDFAAGKAAWLAAGLPIEGAEAGVPRAGGYSRVDVPTCSLDESLQSVRDRVSAAGWDTCIVVNDARIVLGRLGRSALTGGSDATVEQAMSEGPSTIRPDTTLEAITQRLREQKLTTALVTTLEGTLVGLLRLDDAERALGRG